MCKIQLQKKNGAKIWMEKGDSIREGGGSDALWQKS